MDIILVSQNTLPKVLELLKKNHLPTDDISEFSSTCPSSTVTMKKFL